MRDGERQMEGRDTQALPMALWRDEVTLRKTSSGELSLAIAALMNLITALDKAASSRTHAP